MNYLVIWTRDGGVEAVRAFKTKREAERLAQAWAEDPENAASGEAHVWDLKRNQPAGFFET